MKIHKCHVFSDKLATCCACHRGANRSAHSSPDSEDTSRLIVKSRKHDVEVLTCATPCVQFYPQAMLYMDNAEFIEKLYKQLRFQAVFS